MVADAKHTPGPWENAVEGIPTEALEGGVVRELVEVLDDARRVIDSYAPHYARLITRIDAALAKVRGGEA